MCSPSACSGHGLPLRRGRKSWECVPLQLPRGRRSVAPRPIQWHSNLNFGATPRIQIAGGAHAFCADVH